MGQPRCGRAAEERTGTSSALFDDQKIALAMEFYTVSEMRSLLRLQELPQTAEAFSKRDIKHESKRGNNYQTSFSYTRCSVQSRIRGVGSGSVSDRSAIARHDASFIKLLEWSEQLRPLTSVRLGTVRRRVQIRLCTERWVREKETCLGLFPRLDLC